MADETTDVDIDDLEDLTEPYPAEHELVEDHEKFAGEDVDDSWLDTDGDGIPDHLDETPNGEETKTVHVEGELEITEGGN